MDCINKQQWVHAKKVDHRFSTMLIERNGKIDFLSSTRKSRTNEGISRDAWDKCRSMTKEQAMSAYIDEIRKILETMPQTNEVLEFTQLIGPFYEFVDDQTGQNPSVSLKKKKLNDSHEPLVNGNSDGRSPSHPRSDLNFFLFQMIIIIIHFFTAMVQLKDCFPVAMVPFLRHLLRLHRPRPSLHQVLRKNFIDSQHFFLLFIH